MGRPALTTVNFNQAALHTKNSTGVHCMPSFTLLNESISQPSGSLIVKSSACYFPFRELGFVMIELEPEDHTDLGIIVGGYKTADGRYRV